MTDQNLAVISVTKNVKQVHSVAPNLKHKLLADSTITILRCQNKQLKIQQLESKNI